MKPDRRDLELLRLVGRYRWLPLGTFGKFGFAGIHDAIEELSKIGYISISRNKRYIMVAPKGCTLLNELGFKCDTSVKRAYENYGTLRRRLEAGSIMLTALRAGIGAQCVDVDALRNQPTFLPSFALRTAAANPMSNGTCAGFGHWGGKSYMLHYASSENKGMYLTNELKTFHNLGSVFSERLDEQEAMVFAGDSYKQAYAQIKLKAASSRHGVKGFSDFAEIYRSVDIPVHLLSCDETGAMQLALMRQPGYNARIAKAAYGERWAQRDEQIPDADGSIDGGRTLLIAADMDVRRAVRVVEDAKNLGKKGVALIAFKEQLEGLLMGLFPHDGFVTYLQIKQQVLDAAFGKGFSLCDFGGEMEGSGRYG